MPKSPKKPRAATPKQPRTPRKKTSEVVPDDVKITNYPTAHPPLPIKKRMFEIVDKAELKIVPPTTPLTQSKTIKAEDYPKRGQNRTPDRWTDLPERTRSYLKLWPYGSNIIVDRNGLVKLQDFFLDIRELPLPDTVWRALNKHQDAIRAILELIPLADWDEQQRERLKDSYEAFFPNYTCKCHTKRRRAKKNTSTENDE